MGRVMGIQSPAPPKVGAPNKRSGFLRSCKGREDEKI